MNVYFVVEAPVTEFEDNVFFQTLEINNSAAFLSEQEAKDHAKNVVQAHRGKAYWIVKGNPIYVMECRPSPIIISPIVNPPTDEQLAELIDGCGQA